MKTTIGLAILGLACVCQTAFIFKQAQKNSDVEWALRKYIHLETFYNDGKGRLRHSGFMQMMKAYLDRDSRPGEMEYCLSKIHNYRKDFKAAGNE